MLHTTWRRLLASLFRPTVRTRRTGGWPANARRRRRRLRLERLEDRVVPAVKTNFSNGLLSITLDAANDTANIAVVGSNVEVRDGSNTLISSTATNTITDISAAGNHS